MGPTWLSVSCASFSVTGPERRMPPAPFGKESRAAGDPGVLGVLRLRHRSPKASPASVGGPSLVTKGRRGREAGARPSQGRASACRSSGRRQPIPLWPRGRVRPPSTSQDWVGARAPGWEVRLHAAAPALPRIGRCGPAPAFVDRYAHARLRQRRPSSRPWQGLSWLRLHQDKSLPFLFLFLFLFF